MHPSDDRTQTPIDATAADAPTLPPIGEAPTHAFAPNTTSWQPPVLPATFGRYEVRKLLGKGGMGAVYLAHDPQLERQVALKIPTFAVDDSDEHTARFYREARAVSSLNHPGICPVYEVDQIGGTLYLTMAYIEGQPLSALVKPGHPLSPEQATRLVREIAVALQEAHDHGVIHRDLKPANIMLSKKGQPVIMDFGLARRTTAAEEARLTRSGVVMGTPAYMAPEQVNGEIERMGPATDVYALGGILYELLTGKLPFEGALGTLMARILLDPPPPLSTHIPGLDWRLEAAIQKAMAKQPEHRYSSAAEMANALTAILDTPVPPIVETHKVTVAEPMEALLVEPAPRRRRREPAVKATAPDAPASAPAKKTHHNKVWMLSCGGCLLVVTLALGGLGYLLYVGVNNVVGLVNREIKRSQEFDTAARMWRPPAADAGPEELCPKQVGAFTRQRQGTKIDLPKFDIKEVGHQATYRDMSGKVVELYVLRKNDQESYGLVSKAYKVVEIKEKDRSGDGYRSVRGSPEAPPLIYSHRGVFDARGSNGVFWWKSGWLLHVASADLDTPDDFLREYLITLTQPKPAAPPPPGRKVNNPPMNFDEP